MMKRRISATEIVLAVIPLLIGAVAWSLTRSESDGSQFSGVLDKYGVRDLGLLTVDDKRAGMTQMSPIIASRALSDWVQADPRRREFAVKWRYPNPAPGWAQWVLTYNRPQGTLKVECSLYLYGPQGGSQYSGVTDAILAKVANRPTGSLLDYALLTQLGCSQKSL